MKKITFTLLILTIFYFTNASADIKRYLVQSGEVQYKITASGSMMGMPTKLEGDSYLYFKKYGAVEVTKEKTSQDIMGQKEITEDLTKIEDDIVYSVDFEDNVIYRQRIPVNQDEAIFQNTEEETLKSLGAKKIGTDKIAGFKCTIWELNTVKMCIYKGVPLKIESNVIGLEQTQIAVSAKFNTHIDDNKFMLPNYPIKEMNEIRLQGYEEMKNQMKNMTPEQQEIIQNMINQ